MMELLAFGNGFRDPLQFLPCLIPRAVLSTMKFNIFFTILITFLLTNLKSNVKFFCDGKTWKSAIKFFVIPVSRN